MHQLLKAMAVHGFACKYYLEFVFMGDCWFGFWVGFFLLFWFFWERGHGDGELF